MGLDHAALWRRLSGKDAGSKRSWTTRRWHLWAASARCCSSRGKRVADSDQAIGIDVGGTKIAGVRVARDGTILDRATRPTPAEDPDATIAAMIEVARTLRTKEVLALGVGAAGMVSVVDGVLRFAPNLAWRELPIAQRIGGALDLPCQVDNDANVAAWGEHRFGAGRGYRHMLLVTVGTGIGGGIVSDGRLLRGAHGFAAEIGHIVVEPGGPLCGCGNHGCWEQVASGHAIDRLGGEAVRQHPGRPSLALRVEARTA